jgi:DUF1009 family protein
VNKLGIVAGGGTLPARVVEACRAQGREVFVLALKGHTDEAALPPDVPREWITLGEGGRGFDILHRQGVRDLVMVGPVRRPTLKDLTPDWRTIRFFAKAGLRALGDDGLLRALVAELEEEGFHVVGVDTLLKDIVAPEGLWGRHAPDAQAEADIRVGIAAARDLGAHDLGQAAVAQQGRVLAVEDAEGTAALIRRAGAAKMPGAGPVLAKTAKPGQEMRVDMPTIGAETVTAAAAAGFAGIAVQAGATLVVDRSRCIAAADAAGLFLIGVAVP